MRSLHCSFFNDDNSKGNTLFFYDSTLNLHFNPPFQVDDDFNYISQNKLLYWIGLFPRFVFGDTIFRQRNKLFLSSMNWEQPLILGLFSLLWQSADST